MVPDRQPLNILFILFALISLIDLTLQAPLTGNAPQQIDQCPGNGIYGYLNGTQIGKRDDYIHLEMEDLNLEECIKQCYGNHFCYSIYYDETIKNRCVFYYYAGYNCTGKTLVPISSLKHEGKPITLDCIRCPGKGDILSTTHQTIVGNIDIGNSVNGISINDDKINSIEKANIIQQSPNTGDSSSSNGNINETLNSSDDSSCVLEFIPNFEDVGDEVGELFTNTINDIKDEKECAKLCHNSKCDYAMYKPSTKICSYISDYFGFIKNCSSKPLQNFVLGVMDNKTIETIQIECIRCRQNHIEDVKNINDNKINHSSSKNNEGEWQSMTVDPGDAVTWPTNLQLSGHCVVVFQVDEDEERISKLEFSNETQLQTVEQCAAHCYKSSCSNAVFQFLEHGKGICKISTNTSDICSSNHQHHYRFYTTKTVGIQCIRCLAKKPTTQSPNSLLPGFMDLSSTTAVPPTEEPSITPEQQYESNEGGKSETKMLTSPDGQIDKGGEVKEDDEEHTDISLKTARPPSSAPIDEEEVRSGATSTTPKVNINEESESSPTKDISTTESTTTKDVTTTEGFTTTVAPSMTTIETPVVSKVVPKEKNGNEDPYLRSCVVAFQVKPFSLEDEPKQNEPLMEYEFLTDSVSICATKCYNNGCTGAIYNAETNKCVLQLGKVLKCIGGDTYNNYFPEKNEKIRLFCISCTPDNFKGIEGQIRSNKNGSESTTIVSKIDAGTVGSESDLNNVTTSPVVKPGSVFEALTTTPKDENEESTTVGSKKDDESLGNTTSDQSIETTTLISERGNINKITTSSNGIMKSESTTGSSSGDDITEPEKSQDTNVNQTTSLPSSESKEGESSEVTTKSPETKENEGSITMIVPEISEGNKLSTAIPKSDKEIEETTISTDVEGSGISSDRFDGENKTTTNSRSEDEATTIITEGSTAVPEVKKEEDGTTSSSGSEKQDKITTVLTGEDNIATTPSGEYKKEGTELTKFSESDKKKGETTTDGTVTDKEKMDTTLLPESEKEEKVTTILSGEDNQATVPTSVDEINGMETTTSLENEKDQSTMTEGDENKATTILPEGEHKGVEITTVSKIENEGSGDATVGQEGKEKLETTTNIQEFEQETSVKASSERDKTIETTTNIPELGLEISKDINPKQSEKSSESETIEPTSIKPEGLEKMFESSTAPTEEKVEFGDSENDKTVATTLLIPVEFETTTAKGLEISKDNENGPIQKPVGESESTTIEPEEGSGVEEIDGKASTIIDIKDNPSEEDVNLGEERKSTVIPIIDSNQNTENLFPEEKPSTTVSPNNIDSTTVSSVNGESLSPDEKARDKETTIASTDLEETKLETVPMTDDKGEEDTETTNPSNANGESSSHEENVEEKEPTTMSPDIEETKLETVPLVGDKSEEGTETTTASLADRWSSSSDRIAEDRASTTISPLDGQESSSSVSKTEGKGDVTTISPDSEQEKLETISPNGGKAGKGSESTTVSSENKEPLSPDEKEITTISPLDGQESSSTVSKAEGKGDVTTISPDSEQEKLETISPNGEKAGEGPESTTVSLENKEPLSTDEKEITTISPLDGQESSSTVSKTEGKGDVTTISPDSEQEKIETISPNGEKAGEGPESTTVSSENKEPLSTDEKEITTISPLDGQESSSTVSKTEGKGDVTTISPDSEQEKIETISPNGEKAGEGPESTTVSSENKEPLSTDEKEITTISPLDGQESSSTVSKAEGKGDVTTISPDSEQEKLETISPNGGKAGKGSESTTVSSENKEPLSPDEKEITTISPLDGQESSSTVSKAEGKGDVTTISPDSEQEKIETISPNGEKAGEGSESTTVSSENKKPLSTDEKEPITISPLVGQESSSFAPKAEDKGDMTTSSPEVEKIKLETVPSIGDNTQATLESVNPETTTFSLPEMGLEISNDRGLQSIPTKDHNKSVTESVTEASTKANEVTSIKPKDENNNLATIFSKSEVDTEKQSTGSVEPENTTGVSEFEKGDEDEKVILDNQRKTTTNVPSLRSENQNVESTSAPENTKEVDININLPEEAKESEVSATTTEKTIENLDKTTLIPETEKEASTSAGTLDSKKGGSEITTITKERVGDKEELTTISSNVDKEPFAASTTPESKTEPENVATIAPELDNGGKTTPEVFDKENKGLATTIEPEVGAESFDFESGSKKSSTTVSNKESDLTTVVPKIETTKEGIVGGKEIDLTTVTPKSDATDEGTISGKESDLTTVVPKNNTTDEGEENRKKSGESTTVHLDDKNEEGSFVTTKSPEKNTSEFESTQTEGSGETLENENGEPTVFSTDKEDEELTTIAPDAGKEVTNIQKIPSESETIEPSTISTGSEFIATTPGNVEETTLTSNLEKDEKSELESTTLSGKDNKGEQKSTTELTSIDFENQGKPLEGSAFGEKEMTLKTTITPEKENGSSDKGTTPLPKNAEESNNEKPSKGGDANENEPSHNETTQSPKDVEESNNKKVTEEGVDKDSGESSGEEIVDNQEFSSNNTNGLPEMGLEISRFRGLSADPSNKTESSTSLPKTSHNEDESSSITISTEAITEENEATSTIDSEKKEDGTTIKPMESTEPSSLTESSIDDSKTTIKIEEVQKESEEPESTTKIMSLESPTTILPESEGSGIEDETKGTKIESTTENMTHDAKKTEELFPDDEQIEKLHAQSSTTKLASEQPSTTTESSNGPAFVTEDEEESEDKGTPTSIVFETTVKNDFNVDLTTITSIIDKINDKETTIQTTETLITTTAIPIDEQLFTVQPFKGLDVQSSKKNQSTNDFTTIPGEIKENEQGSNLSSSTSIQQTGSIGKVTSESVLETTEKPEEVKDNEEVEGSTISSIKNNSEGSRDEKLSSTTVSTIESSTKSEESGITTVGLEESKNEGDGKESTIESRIVSDGNENNDHTTTISIETKGEENDKENSLTTTIPKVIEGEIEDTTIKGSEQEDSKVTTEPKSKPESVDFEFSEKTSVASSENIELTTIGTLKSEGQNEKVTIEGSGEEVETTTLGDQKSDGKVTRPETEEEEIITTLLPATKMTIIEGENKTNTLSPLAGDLEVTETNNTKEVSTINNVNTTSLGKTPSEGDNVNVIITASTVKTVLNETTSSEENGELPNEKSFKQDNSQTTITTSSTTTQNPTDIKIQTMSTKNDAEGPAFVTEEPEVTDKMQGQTSTTTETPDQLTTQSLESPKSDGSKFEELIPEEKKKEEELDASKIDFGPTTTIGNSQFDGQATTIESVKGFGEDLQTTTSTIITEDDGSIIDTSILKKGKIDTTNPKETDVTLITEDSVATTIDIKDEGNSEESTVKTNLESNEETTTAKESFVTESPNKSGTTIVSEKDKESDKESNKDSNSHDGFIIEKVETTTLKDKTKETTSVDTTTVSEEIMSKVTFKQDNEDEIPSIGIQTTIQPTNEEIEFSAKENTKPPKEETTITSISGLEETSLPEKEKDKSQKVTEKPFDTISTVKSDEPETESGQTAISQDNLTTQKSSEDKTTEGKVDVEETTVKSTIDIIEGTTDFNGEPTDTQSTHIPIIHDETSTTSESLTTEVTFAVTKEQGTAESIDSATINKHIDLPKTVGKVDSPISIGEKIAKEDDSEEKSTDKEDYEDKVFVEDIDSKSHGKDKVHTTTEPPVAAVADLVHTLSRTNDLDLLLRGASKQLVDIRKNAKCGLNTLRFAARAMKDFSQEYEVIESVPSLYACLEACYEAGCKKAAFVPYPQPKCLMHYELGTTLVNSCTSSSIYQLTTHWHFSNPSEVIEILCLVCDNDNENSKEKLQIENVFNLLVDDTRKGMEQQAYMTEICNGAGRLEFQVKPVSKYPRLNITHDVPANSPAECAMKCKENGHCDLAGFVPSPHAKSSGLCLLTSDTHYCDYEDETYKHVSQHQSEVPFLLHCIRCSKCRYNLIPVIPGITEVIPFETTETANSIEECALKCSKRKCTTAQFNPKSLTCSTTINPSFKSTCPTEKAIQVDGNLQIRLHCVSCIN